MAKRHKWSETDLIILKDKYENTSLRDLAKIFRTRSQFSIQQCAQRNGLKRNLSLRRNRNFGNTVNKLLEETNEAYYWIGFIMADGCFYSETRGSKTYHRLSVGISIKDRVHLEKFCKFINNKFTIIKYNFQDLQGNGLKNYPMIRTRIGNADVIPKIMKKFNLKNRKTYDPPQNLRIRNNDLFLSLLIGYIDGDGSIRKRDGEIKIQCHASWDSLLSQWFDRAFKCAKCKVYNRSIKIPKAHIGKDGYCYISTRNKKLLMFLKDKGKNLSIPFLHRKWDNISSFGYEK